MATKKVIEVENLRKTYGSTVAVDDISFDVAEGEIFGIVAGITVVAALLSTRFFKWE